MRFKTKEPLTPDDGTPYLLRSADSDLEILLQRLDYVALIGSRMSGKTSMLMRAWARLSKLPRYALSYVNLSRYSTLTEADWYSALYAALVQAAPVGALPVDLVVQDAIDLREALLMSLEEQIPNQVLIIMLDDVEAVPMTIRTAFFATLREMFVSRGIYPAFRRVAFVLAGSYIPDELIPDPSISPFRVAEKVYIEDAEDITPLVAHLAPEVGERIFAWTEGDVYLTQRLCERLDRRYEQGVLTSAAVDQVVERYLLDDDLFDGLDNKLRAEPPIGDVLRDILMRGTNLRFTRTNHAIAEAWLLGCIKPNRYQNCVMRNAVYDSVVKELLKRQPAPKLRQPTPPPPTHPPPLRGRYVLESLLKRGMTTHIYRARDQYLGGLVVVKQLLASARGGDMIAWRRFQREGEALQRLQHPHIVELVDFFQDGDFNYIVMEYVNGGTADSLLNREGRQPVNTILAMMLGVSDALRHAHQNQIVHRDIKPSNILLTQELVPKLADFGVAHFVTNAARITAQYAVVGTPAYLCPEGYDNSYFTPAEDIWSLGVTMYELLTGVLPFNGRTQEHIRHAVQHDPIPDVRQIRPDVSPELAALLLQMLQRDPAARLPDGAAVYAALQAFY